MAKLKTLSGVQVDVADEKVDRLLESGSYLPLDESAPRRRGGRKAAADSDSEK